MTTDDDLTRHLHKYYTPDVAQQALYLTWERQARSSISGPYTRYAVAMAHILRDAGWDDTRVWRQRKSWNKGGVDIRADSGLNVDPVRRTMAREELARLPDWLIELHLDTGFVYKARCGHDAVWLYLAHSSTGPYVRCRRCTARRDTAYRVHRREVKKQGND